MPQDAGERVAESFLRLVLPINDSSCRTRWEARRDLFHYIESFYNRRHLHSSLGYQSPVAYEQAYHQMSGTA